MTDDQFYTVPDVAARLKVDPETVRRWVRSGRLRAFQVSRQSGYRIPASALTDFIERHLTGTVGNEGEERGSDATA